MRTYISQHVFKTFWLPPVTLCAIVAGIFCILLAEVQEELMIREKC